MWPATAAALAGTGTVGASAAAMCGTRPTSSNAGGTGEGDSPPGSEGATERRRGGLHQNPAGVSSIAHYQHESRVYSPLKTRVCFPAGPLKTSKNVAPGADGALLPAVPPPAETKRPIPPDRKRAGGAWDGLRDGRGDGPSSREAPTPSSERGSDSDVKAPPPAQATGRTGSGSVKNRTAPT